VVEQPLDGGEPRWRVVATLQAWLLGRWPPLVVALDVPIGLPDAGARACDLEVRRLLGQPRGTSVFPAPIRSVLEARDFEEACEMRTRVDGCGLTRQAWNIVPRIREADELLRAHPSLLAHVREVHPELCYFMLNGHRPVNAPKRSAAGHAQRAVLLREVFGGVIDRALAEVREVGCRADDMLDAFAALWTARRVVTREAINVPAGPHRDRCGLPMEMVV
jgi:predicted RNase H-like nuclease